ncbi:hypothetical protein EIN_452200 [Entamoeba invadens IP1]|uniref:DUF4371 domain-containing protein n=1 Tax=Entamoeba invadens IP1 TaxID=370355 RepID=A0A0A1U9E2_ENTIV|nr:hypothetical protein EIN_452200 [Entamoeba invadens IP1]ELP91539.1 hypothetical protein EIN_452200 [Entamoeba invadens IP1]|eukprot:XP_004258310.1 hypothetical protein EIN_452200 [Entamoeba invadens IP1]
MYKRFGPAIVVSLTKRNDAELVQAGRKLTGQLSSIMAANNIISKYVALNKIVDIIGEYIKKSGIEILEKIRTSEQTITRKVFEQAETCVNEVDQILSDSLYIGVLEDESKISKDSWYSYYIRAVDKDLKIHTRLLEAKVQYGKASGLNLSYNMKRVLEDHNIDYKKVAEIGTDGGSNTRDGGKGMAGRIVSDLQAIDNRYCPIFSMWCMCHRLNLCVEECIKDNGVNDCIYIISSVCDFLRDDPKFREQFKCAPPTYVKTRFLSLECVFRWVYNNYDNITIFLKCSINDEFEYGDYTIGELKELFKSKELRYNVSFNQKELFYFEVIRKCKNL